MSHNLLQLVVMVFTVAMLYAATRLYLVGEILVGALLLVIAAGFALVFSSQRFYHARFVFPGVATVLLFIAFPVAYTVWLGFTNYSSTNLLTQARVLEVHLSKSIIDKESQRPFALQRDGDAYRLVLPESAGALVSEAVLLDGRSASVPVAPVETMPEELLSRRDVVRLRKALGQIELVLPDGTLLRSAGLRAFARVTPEYALQDDGRLISNVEGSSLTPDDDVGFYRDDAGKRVPPGWRVTVGTDNFERIATSDGVRKPMTSIFLWTFGFALVSVLLCFTIGLLLAMILQWPHLRGKAVYRVLLILPYAVPSFISILVFRGLFNQNFGEINMILNAFFGLRPEWFTDPFLARSMIVVVNVWLGYPYMMLLAMGFLQSIPEDQKKAAALEGAGSVRIFFTLTLPQILPPFLPLLISAFAFNFNNIVLILLLTNGGPDIPGTIIPAGHTDILGSFTYRISFLDSGQQFGLAGAITFIIFLVVGGFAYANFVAMRRATNRNRSAA